MPRKCSFQDSWLTAKDYCEWVRKDATDQHSARCLFCGVSLKLTWMGESVLRQHAKTERHRKNERQFKADTRCSMTDFFTASSASSSRSGLPSTVASSTCSSTSTSSASSEIASSQDTGSQPRQSKIKSTSDVENDRLKAEIMWALKVVDCHYSYRSSEQSGDLFRTMFPDSGIAASFKCGETRCRYLTTFGLAPHFSELLQKNIKASSQFGYVLLFDESLNKQNHLKQMDVMIRIWEDSLVKTHYLTSEFMGHATGIDLTQKFASVFSEFKLEKRGLLQLGMDGPNVNWTVYNTMNCDLKDNLGVSLLHVGSCGLHTVHNAFHTGCEATGWKIEEFLSAAYRLFEDSPARLEDYYATTHATSLPLKFCRHRWLENAVPAMRAIELLPSLKLFVDAALGKKITLPRNASFEIVKAGVNSPLLACQLSFFASIARLIEPFLKKYQSDKPLMPFLATDLQTMLKNLMKKFIKEEALVDAPSLTRIDIHDANINLPRVKLDFKTTSLLNQAKKHPAISEGQLRDFDQQSRYFLKKVVEKLMNKCPLKYGVVRTMGCLDPTKLQDKKTSEENMQHLLKIVVDSKRITEQKADHILQEYSDFLPTACTHSASSFNVDTDRVDTWWSQALQGSSTVSNLTIFVKTVLLLSHGQATVERGFSYNKEVSTENLSQKALKARRVIIDHIRDAGGVLQVKIDKPLLVSASAAWSKYNQHLQQERQAKETAQSQLKRKAVTDQITELKKKKKAAEDNSRHLVIEADSLSMKAQEQRSFTLLSRSNELRLSAKDKSDEASNLASQLAKKEEELKKL